MYKLFNHPNLLCANEVAKVLGIKASTISKWVYENKIPFVKFGPGRKSLVKFNPERLNEWIDENSHEPKSEENIKKNYNKKVSKNAVIRFNNFVSNLQK